MRFSFAVNLLKRWAIFSSIADITTYPISENHNKVAPYLSHPDRIMIWHLLTPAELYVKDVCLKL